MTFAAGNRLIMEFGARRAQGPQSAIYGAVPRSLWRCRQHIKRFSWQIVFDSSCWHHGTVGSEAYPMN